MTKGVALLFLLSCLSFGASKESIIGLIANKEYAKACESGQYVAKESMDGRFLIEYGKACMNSDNLDMLSPISAKLRGSKESREAAAVFETLQAQKKLLYIFLLDGTSLRNLKMPKINHPISMAFEHISSGEYAVKSGIISFKDGGVSYEITTLKNSNPPKFILLDKSSGKERIYF